MTSLERAAKQDREAGETPAEGCSLTKEISRSNDYEELIRQAIVQRGMPSYLHRWARKIGDATGKLND